MEHNFLVFGNHPKLSLAEFLAVLPQAKIVASAPKAAVVEAEGWRDDVLMSLLGGTIKLGTIIGQMPVAELTAENIVELLANTDTRRPKGALEFGWTVYGVNDKQKKTFGKFPIQIKNAFKKSGWKVRWVSGPGGEPLSPAAVAKCHLTEAPNCDLCLIINHDQAYVGRTTQVQDADAWSLRDYGRPRRDDVNGMLPPKLARMMVNLAEVPDGGALLDPFCGSGTVLMEAALATQAKKLIGSDIQAGQVADTNQNLSWLKKKNIIRPEDMARFTILQADVKALDRHLKPKSVDAVVTEGWLGPPLKGRETINEIEKNATEIARLWKEALTVLRTILQERGRIVATFPSFKHGPLIASVLDKLDYAKLGYRLDSLPAGLKQEDLYYERSGQHLRRNIRILVKS